MDFRTEIFPAPPLRPIGHSSRIVSVGSCFAERMGDRLRHYKFRLLQNPFGIIFHPLPLIAPLAAALSGENLPGGPLFLHDGRWRSLAFHSQLSHPDKHILQDKIQAALQATGTALRKADVLILTLGSAIGFQDRETGTIVANCHKLPQQRFASNMSRVHELRDGMAQFFAHLFAENPAVQVLLSVSPVRHLRAGMVENGGSKAVLRCLCEELCADFERVSYFPAYELLMDDLRDYRFYGRDLTHPSEMAEDYVWEKFSTAWLSDTARQTNSALDGIFRDLAHRPFDAGSEAHLAFLGKLLGRIGQLRGVVDLDLEFREVEDRLRR
ncbi:MAG: hypothetical protein RLZZ165_624 [Bacteroidota bacterium]